MLRWGGGATKCKTRNQVQIFSVIKCTEAFEVTLTIRLAHPFITARIQPPTSLGGMDDSAKEF